MHLGKRKKIALMISRVPAEYQNVLSSNIARKAAEYGYYTLVYNTFGGYGGNTAYELGEQIVAEMPDYETLDGIILAIDTIDEEGLAGRIIENVKKRATCPVVCVRRAVEDYHSVLVDEKDAMGGMVRHLVEDHGYRDFCYVSGPKGHPDAEQRLECFERMMKKYGLVCGADSICFGDFWRARGREIVDELLEGRSQYPDVIVCANDYMAISVSNALQDRGICVPEDIAVTGFDDISEAKATIPSLTSTRVDVATMAERAVEMLHQLQMGYAVPKYEYIPTQVVRRDSCGCVEESGKRRENEVRGFFDKVQQHQAYNLQTIFMSIDAEATRDMDTLNRVIYRYAFNNQSFRDFFLVLNDYDWNKQDSKDFEGFTKKVHLRTAIQENYLLGHIDHIFDFGDILPEEYVYEEPCAYYISPLHYQEACFGYCMINYRDGYANGPFMQLFMTNICNAIESIRIRRKMSLLIDQLQDLYVSDVLTGLFNRHGFEKDSAALYEQAVNEGRSVAIIGIDMDGLKIINDTFGHAHGDIALRALANAISAATFASEKCYRVGGDEFQVLAVDYSEEMVESFLERLDGFLQDYNARSKRPYIVQASYGYMIKQSEDDYTLAELLTISDNRMYDRKEASRATRVIVREEKGK